MRATTGDSAVSVLTKAVDLVKLPILTQVELTDADNLINSYIDSGKEKGAVVLCQTTPEGDPAVSSLVFAVATGNQPTDPWNLTGAGLVVTPVSA